MDYENRTLGSLLSDPRIAPAAPDAIRAWDLSKEPIWNKTLLQLREEHIFAGDLSLGFDRLFRAADTGDWYYPLYAPAECALRRKGPAWSVFPPTIPPRTDGPSSCWCPAAAL